MSPHRPMAAKPSSEALRARTGPQPVWLPSHSTSSPSLTPRPLTLMGIDATRSTAGMRPSIWGSPRSAPTARAHHHPAAQVGDPLVRHQLREPGQNIPLLKTHLLHERRVADKDLEHSPADEAGPGLAPQTLRGRLFPGLLETVGTAHVAVAGAGEEPRHDAADRPGTAVGGCIVE